MDRIKPLVDVHADVLIPQVADLHVRTANATDAPYIIDRAYRWRKRVGWLPASAIEDAIARGMIWQCLVDGQRAGHVLITGGDRVPAVLRHNCVELDLWGRGVGTVFTGLYLAAASLATPHTHAEVRTRQDIGPQNLINVRTGAIAAEVHEPAASARGKAVVTWRWHLRQRRQQAPRVGVNGTITTPMIAPLLGGLAALPDGGPGTLPVRRLAVPG